MLTRPLWQLKIVIFMHWCIVRIVLLIWSCPPKEIFEVSLTTLFVSYTILMQCVIQLAITECSSLLKEYVASLEKVL